MSGKKLLASILATIALYAVSVGDRSLAADDSGAGAGFRAVIPYDPSASKPTALESLSDEVGNTIQEFEYEAQAVRARSGAAPSVDIGDGTTITP